MEVKDFKKSKQYRTFGGEKSKIIQMEVIKNNKVDWGQVLKLQKETV
jgi:hypothetical protein